MLTNVAASPIDAPPTGGVAQTVASALSSVASSALAAAAGATPSTGGATPGAAPASSAAASAALASVGAIVASVQAAQADALASRLAALPAGSTASLSSTTSSPLIQTLVAVSPPGAPPAATASPISAPGSASSFDPLPRAALPAGAAVVTTFSSLAFDPNYQPAAPPPPPPPTLRRTLLLSANDRSPSGVASDDVAADPDAALFTTTGVTRLSFSTPTLGGGSAPLVVSNLLTPIVFTLPPVPLAAPQSGAGAAPPSAASACKWWDAGAGRYSSSGCVSLPNPSPLGAVLFFPQNLETPNDASLSDAWAISGPPADNCASLVLDCSLPDGPRSVFPDPSDPLNVPAVACPPSGTPALRVFTGARCSLVARGAAAGDASTSPGCVWDARRQVFSGGGCSASRNATSCACRHLTTFASGA